MTIFPLTTLIVQQLPLAHLKYNFSDSEIHHSDCTCNSQRRADNGKNSQQLEKCYFHTFWLSFLLVEDLTRQSKQTLVILYAQNINFSIGTYGAKEHTDGEKVVYLSTKWITSDITNNMFFPKSQVLSLLSAFMAIQGPVIF